MKFPKLAAIAAAVGSVLTTGVQAENTGALTPQNSTMIELAGRAVPVLKGGLYDRYRSNPPLEVIAREQPGLDLSWFKTLTKQRVDIGFESYSPNFYYRNSRITAVFTADLDVLNQLMPEAVKQQVQPLQVWPGRGVVALTAYTYYYCDNDSYNEIALSIVTNKPGSRSWGPLTLAGQSMDGDFWGYVLKLPVNTELARVRGVVGYNLPKWLTPIELQQDNQSVSYRVIDSASGKAGVVIRGAKLADLSDEVVMAKSSFTNLSQAGELQTGFAESRQLLHASSDAADSVTLELGKGAFADYIRALDLGKLLKYEYVPDFQIALYTPEPLTEFLAAE